MFLFYHIQKCALNTYSEIEAIIASAVRNKMSLPSIKTKSHTRSTQLFGRHVQKSVKNHCINSTFISGGSIESIYEILSERVEKSELRCERVIFDKS